MSGPRVTSGRGISIQEVGTPPAFLRAVEAKLGAPVAWDLAADESNHVAPGWFGPGSAEPDAFKAIWHAKKGLLWLNPPFQNLADWTARAAAEAGHGANVALLMPAAIGTNYFREWVWPFARIYALSPRLKFVGHSESYPKDLVLAHFDGRGNYGVPPGFECWRWDRAPAAQATEDAA